ncbi:MAG: hypothetical protein J1E43_04785 [Christensenellaceae bacterium]|nr:hypothetical protein [Christensenellaceae bacterium]
MKERCLLISLALCLTMTCAAAETLRVPEYANFTNGGYGAAEAFAQRYPDLSVEIAGTGAAPDMNDIVRAMTTQDGSQDVLWVMMQTRGYRAMRERGYCAALEASETLRGYVEAMYPFIADELWHDGRLCAIPVGISCLTAAFSRDAMELMGLSEEELPANLMSLMDFIADWDEDAPVRLSDWDAEMLRFRLFTLIRDAQEAWCASQGKPLTYDDPVFRALLEKLEQITPMLQKAGAGGGQTVLMNLAYDLAPGMYRNEVYMKPVLLARAEGEEPHLKAYVDLYAVNPYSSRQEEAVAFLECTVLEADSAPLMSVLLHPDEDTLIENITYQAEASMLNDMLAQQEGMLQSGNLSGDERIQFEDSVAWTRAQLAALETSQWVTSPEKLALWREAAQHMTVPMDSGGSDDLIMLRDRYMAGQLSADQFIREAEGVLWMMRQE